MYRVLESRLPKGILRIRPRADSLFSWSVEQNTRDTQMNTRMTEGESFIPGGSSLRSNPFIEEWCPFRIPTNSTSSYHFFCSHKVHRSIQEHDPNKHLNDNFLYPFKVTPFGQSLSYRPPKEVFSDQKVTAATSNNWSPYFTCPVSVQVSYRVLK